MKHTFYSLLPLFLLLDLVIPFLLATTCPGYRHTRQVMSVLGNRSAPFHTVYTLWLLFLGTAILLTCAQLCPLLWGRSGGLSLALAAILIIYALGGCILSGLFPVSETKAMETLSAKIHGFGSVFGFLALTFAPLVVALFYFKGRQTGLALCALTCFILALVFFVLFVMADKPRFAHTVIAWEGLWQRLTLLFMYLPLALLCARGAQEERSGSDAADEQRRKVCFWEIQHSRIRQSSVSHPGYGGIPDHRRRQGLSLYRKQGDRWILRDQKRVAPAIQAGPYSGRSARAAGLYRRRRCISSL